MDKISTDQLAHRRTELIARCAEQRTSLHLQTQRWRKALSVHDAAYAALDYVKRYQGWIIAAAVAVVVIKPRRIATVLQSGTKALATWRSVEPFVHTLRRRFWQAKHPGRLQM